jgi:hypothetical protein
MRVTIWCSSSPRTGCEHVVTFNLDNFLGIEQLFIEAITLQKAPELIAEL